MTIPYKESQNNETLEKYLKKDKEEQNDDKQDT